MEKKLNKEYWDAKELWLLGIDTPNGIHCCYGGCSAGTLDAYCDCEENKEVREQLYKFVEEHGEVEPLEFGMKMLWFAGKIPELTKIIQEQAKEYGREELTPRPMKKD